MSDERRLAWWTPDPTSPIGGHVELIDADLRTLRELKPTDYLVCGLSWDDERDHGMGTCDARLNRILEAVRSLAARVPSTER